LQHLGVEYAVVAKAAIGQGLRIVFEGVWGASVPV